MKAFTLIGKYLPLVMGSVIGVEQTIQDAPGETKAQVALNLVQFAMEMEEQLVPTTSPTAVTAQKISSMISGVVDIFNKTGIFTKSKPLAEG